MNDFTLTPTVMSLVKAKKIALQRQTDEEDGFQYVVSPKKNGKAIIEVYDEGNTFVGNL